MNYCIVNNFQNINGSDFQNIYGYDINNINGYDINNINGYDFQNINGYDINNINGYDINNIDLNCNYNYYLYILYTFNVIKYLLMLGFSMTFVLIIVSRLYHNMVIDFETNYLSDPSYYEFDTFLFEYLDEYQELQSITMDNSELKKLKNKFIKLNTSKGWVVMNYDHNNNTFNYYSKKNNNITFDYLEVISRIYVTQYNCKYIYIDDTYNYSDDYKLNNS